MRKQTSILHKILDLYKNPIENNKTQLNLSKTCIHINSGGYGSIFLYDDKIFRITINKNKSNDNKVIDWDIPYDIKKNISNQDYLIFLNIPEEILHNKFLYGLIQYYYCISLLILYMENPHMIPNITNIQNQFYKINKDKMLNIYSTIMNTKNKNISTRNINKLYRLAECIFQEKTSPIFIIRYYSRFIGFLDRNTNGLDNISNSSINKNNIELTEKEIFDYNYNKITIKNFKEKIKNINPNLLSLFGNIIVQNKAIGNSLDIYIDCDNKNLRPYKIKDSLQAITNNSNYLSLFITQVLLGLYIYKQESGFCHNDLKPDNILVFKSLIQPISIKYDNILFEFNSPFVFKINDFDFSTTKNIENKLIKKSKFANIVNIYNDIHNLFITLFENPKNINRNIKWIFNEYYETFIKDKCDICDDIIKENKIQSHHVNDTYLIDNKNILAFFKNSKITKKWIK